MMYPFYYKQVQVQPYGALHRSKEHIEVLGWERRVLWHRCTAIDNNTEQECRSGDT